MATLTRNVVTTDGIDLLANLVAADVSGDEVENAVNTSYRTCLVFQNQDGSPKTVTLNSQAECSQGFDHDSVITVPAGGTQIVGPLPRSRWNDSADNKVKWTYSDVTSLTVGVFELSP